MFHIPPAEQKKQTIRSLENSPCQVYRYCLQNARTVVELHDNAKGERRQCQWCLDCHRRYRFKYTGDFTIEDHEVVVLQIKEWYGFCGRSLLENTMLGTCRLNNINKTWLFSSMMVLFWLKTCWHHLVNIYGRVVKYISLIPRFRANPGRCPRYMWDRANLCPSSPAYVGKKLFYSFKWMFSSYSYLLEMQSWINTDEIYVQHDTTLLLIYESRFWKTSTYM